MNLNRSVDPIAMNLPDYNDIIKFPMDLGTVKSRLQSGYYRELANFESDVHLTFDNAMVYNHASSEVHVVAKNLKKKFDALFKSANPTMERSVTNALININACSICGEQTVKFEPPVYYCNGRCGSQRIRRNAHYYTNNNNTFHW